LLPNTAVTLDKVWITSFNGKILVLDFDGNPIGKESDFPFKEKLTGLMGTASRQMVKCGSPTVCAISCFTSPADG